MKVLETVASVAGQVHSLHKKQLTIGFVPTMGALHEGHLSLVRRASLENDVVAISIFVNPIQFNNPADLEKYPRNLLADIELLKPFLKENDLIFAPSVEEMYPEAETKIYDFGALATVMEGRYRPGHFNGVGVVVNKLFRIVQPDRAYFGEKDFQQLAIVQSLTAMEELDIEIIPCPIIREPDGLAMSSRNTRLTPDHRQAAPLIYSTLIQAIETAPLRSPAELRDFIGSTIDQSGLLKVEYVEFADEVTLEPVADWNGSSKIRCFIAVQAGEVRLIDNIPCNINAKT